MRVGLSARLKAAMQEDNGIGGNPFLASYGAEAFVGGGFDADLVAGQPQAGGQAIAHGGQVGFEFGAFGDDDGIDVPNLPPLVEDEFVDLGQKLEAVGSLPLGVFGGEVVADVAEAGGSKHGVHDGVGEDIGIAVADETKFVVNFDAAEDEGAIGAEAVDVIAVTDADVSHWRSLVVNAGLALLSLVWGKGGMNPSAPTPLARPRREAGGEGHQLYELGTV